MISKIKCIYFFVLCVSFAVAKADQLNVVTSSTDLAWVVRQIGGELVDVKALLGGKEDPHFVDASPAFIQKVANADLVCLVGLDLEIGWMPKVLSKSGNAQVQPGGKGYCEAGKGVKVLEKPAGEVNRAMGDVHPSGNPHFWLSPLALAEGAKEIQDSLNRVDPTHAAEYTKGYLKLRSKLDSLVSDMQKQFREKLPPNTQFAEYHGEFAYFFNVYDLHSIGSVEEKPGVPPSAGRLAKFSIDAKNNKVKLVLAADTAPKKTLERFQEVSSIPYLALALSISFGEDYIEHHKEIVQRILVQIK